MICGFLMGGSMSENEDSYDAAAERLDRALQRLEAKRLVATRLSEPRAERGGKARRLVTVTPSGLASVRATAGAITSMLGELGILKDAR